MLAYLRTRRPVESRISSVTGDGGGEGVIDDGSVGRVLAHGLLRRDGGIGVDAAADAGGEAGFVEGGVGLDLAEDGDVIEDPEAAAVRADDEVVVVDDDIADRGGGHVLAERLPVVAVVEGEVDCALGAGVEQAFAHRVFADGVDVLVVGNAVDDFVPGLAAVVGAEDVRAEVVEAKGVDGGVGGRVIEVGGLDEGDFAPFGESWAG